MTTPAQIAANRRNALKSTGPRTAAGKAASSRNGLRHGLTSRRAVVRGEDAQDFERFRAELRSALAPRDAREEVLAETVVYAAWRMRRAWRAEAQLFNRAGHLDPVFSQPRELLTVIRHEASANRAFHRALALLERGRSAAGTVRASPREGGRLDKIVYEKGTQFPDARLSPNALGALGVSAVRSEPSAFVENRQKAGKTAKNHLRAAGIAAHSARPALAGSPRKCLRARWAVSAGSACPREPWVPPSAWIRATSGAPHTPG